MDTAEGLLASLKACHASRDVLGLHNIAHNFKSSAHVVGLKHLAALCKSLEMKTSNNLYSEDFEWYAAAIIKSYQDALEDLLAVRDESLAARDGTTG